MPKANDAPKRDMITFYINAQVRKSAASCRFIEEYRASGEHAEKRDKMLAALVAGQLIEEAGLMPVMQFLDRDNFRELSERQRQMLLVARLQEYLGMTPQADPVAAPIATSQPVEEVATPVAPEAQKQATSEPVQSEAAPAPSGQENAAEGAPEAEKAEAESTQKPKTNKTRFSDKLQGV